MAKAMTYGIVPTRAEFEEAFDREIPHGYYSVKLGLTGSRAADGTTFGTGEYDRAGLYGAVLSLVEKKSDDAVSLAGDVLSTLGFEWI